MAEDVSKDRLSPDVGKPEYLYSRVLESLIESKGFDLLTMGRPEGPGCYCASNEFLRACLDKLVKDYKYNYVVMDCEAGMEHISRQTTRDVDALLLMSDPTMKGVTTAVRMNELIRELRSNVGKIGLIINRVRGELSPEIGKAIEDSGLHILEKRCPARVCPELTVYYILPEKCDRACEHCVLTCPTEAVKGEKGQVKIIDQEKCSKCGTCLEVCPPEYNAVVKLSPVSSLPAPKAPTKEAQR